MTEEPFHLALRENPSDEVTWCALADWLEESGQDRRAELLRLSRQMAMMPLDERADRSARVEVLLRAGVKPVVVESTNALGMRLALVPAGRFLMGSPPEEEGRNENEKSHEVAIRRAFWVGVFPVTQAQWQAVMGSNPSYFCATGGGKAKVQGMATSDFPVEAVSWEDAKAFLEKLNARAEEKEKGRVYRLPTEAEWEYACRGGPFSSTLPFHFNQPSTSLSSSQANFNGNYPYGGAAKGKYLERTEKAGSYEPNALGLYDMHGNVWEWCADWYGEYPDGDATDPSGPPHGSYRVIRGGSWDSYGLFCRSASRISNAPSDRFNFFGFRVAAVPHE